MNSGSKSVVQTTTHTTIAKRNHMVTNGIGMPFGDAYHRFFAVTMLMLRGASIVVNSKKDRSENCPVIAMIDLTWLHACRFATSDVVELEA